MNRPPCAERERALERRFGDLLRTGVLCAALVVLVGGVLYLVRYGRSAPAYAIFRGEPADLRSVGGILREAGALRRAGMIQLGLLILIATPIARVFFAVLAFLWERDFLYVAFTLIVLGVLIFSLVGSGL
jgi:uncharacterized membrane protein